MIELVRAELSRQLRRPRTWLTLAALAAFDIALTVAIAATGSGTLERVGDVPLLITPGGSGYSIPVIALSSTMKFFLPLAVAIFAGESIAGEASSGGLRYGLARPVGRSAYLVSKLLVAVFLSLIAVVIVPVAAVGVGLAAFGSNPLVVVDGSNSALGSGAVATFGAGAALGKLAIASAYVAAGMTSILAFAFLLSTITQRAVVAVAGGVGLTIISRVLNGDYLPGVAVINPYMPNNDVDLWQHLFQDPAETAGMLHFLVLQVVYCAVFLGIAWAWFLRKDVLS